MKRISRNNTGDIPGFWRASLREVPSVLLVVLVYISLKWYDLSLSAFFSMPRLAIFIAVVCIAQAVTHGLCSSGKPFLLTAGKVVYFFFLVNFLSVILADSISRWQYLHFEKLYINGTALSVALFLVLAFLTWRVKGWIYVQNVFLFILLVVVTIGQLTDRPVRFMDNQSITPHEKTMEGRGPANSGPVLLIVMDEYSSSEQVSAIAGDSSAFAVNRELEQRGWVTGELYSEEVSTIHSLASLFNFNLSEQTGFSKMSDYKVSEQCLMKCRLYDSLSSKHVKVVNRGIVDMGPALALNRLYFYPRNFTELMLRHTVLRTLITGKPYKYNKDVLERLPSDVAGADAGSTFFYVHLFMPHPPFAFGDEFPSRDITESNYVEYRKFTDRKLVELTDKLLAARKDLRIVVTGDHGFRRGAMDARKVFAALYGFPAGSMQELRSVQDIGSLVNAGFRSQKR